MGVESGCMVAQVELAERYRRALKLYVGLLILSTPVVFLLAFSMYKLLGSFVPGFVCAAIWTAAWIASGVWVTVLRVRLRRHG